MPTSVRLSICSTKKFATSERLIAPNCQSFNAVRTR